LSTKNGTTLNKQSNSLSNGSLKQIKPPEITISDSKPQIKKQKEKIMHFTGNTATFSKVKHKKFKIQV